MKKFLEKLIAQKNAEYKRLNTALIESENKEERAEIGATLEALAAEIQEAKDKLAELDEPAGGEGGEGGEGNEGGEGVGRKMLLGKADFRQGEPAGTDSIEYRKAFQKFMKTGKMEYRADETTLTTDTNVSTVIPENLINKILEKYEQLGTIYNLVTKTSYAVGQAISTDGIKPVATWIGATAGNSGEGGTSDSQKKQLGARIVFAHYKLRCEIRYSEEVDQMTLPAFEALFVKQVGEAMLRAQEFAIVEGTGSGMPTGILNSEANEGQALTVANADGLYYELLCEAEAAIPTEYENGAKWCMTKKTFMQFVAMTDQQGQPIARVNYGIDGKPERTLLGREVVLYVPQAGSKLKDFNGTTTGLVAFIFDFADYVLNTNYDLGISHARDWDNEDHKTKAVLACDGKVIDKGSLVTISATA